MDSDAQAAAIAELLKTTTGTRHSASFTDEQRAFIKAYLEGAKSAGLRPVWKLLRTALSEHLGYSQTDTTMARKIRADKDLSALL